MCKRIKYIILFLFIIILIGCSPTKVDKTYEVNFYVDGEIVSNIKIAGDLVFYNGSKLDKDGYEFKGWSLVEDGNELYTDNFVTSDTNLYAIFVPKEYKINYQFDYDNVILNNPDTYTSADLNSDGYLKLEEPKLTDYEFVGWRFKGDLVYDGLIRIPDLEDVEIEGVFRPISYKITYDAGLGNITSGAKKSYTVEDVVAFDEPTLKGYQFEGWYLEKDYKTKVTNTEGLSGDITLYAKYSARKYYINLAEKEGVNYEINKIEVSYGSSFNLPVVEKKNYIFKGYVTEDNKLITDELGNSLVNYCFEKDVTVYPTFYPASFTLTIKYNENEGDIVGSGEYLYNSLVQLVATPKDEYSFVGWYLVSLDNVTLNNLLSSDLDYQCKIEGEMIVEARFTKYSLTVSMEEEYGGELLTKYDGQFVTAGKEIELEIKINEGYCFLGWYNNGRLISNEPKTTFIMTKENCNIVSKFATMSSQIQIYTSINEGGSIIGLSTSCYVGQKITAELKLSPNYTFLGWYDFYEDKIISTDLLLEVTVANTAQYIIAKIEGYYIHLFSNSNNSYVSSYVTLDYNGGTGSDVNTILFRPNYTSLTYPNITNPKREGYVFRGWFKDKEATIPFDFCEDLSENITVYAGWLEEKDSYWTYETMKDLDYYNGETLESFSNKKEMTIYTQVLQDAKYSIFLKPYTSIEPISFSYSVYVHCADGTKKTIDTGYSYLFDGISIKFEACCGDLIELYVKYSGGDTLLKIFYDTSENSFVPGYRGKSFATTSSIMLKGGTQTTIYTDGEKETVFVGWYEDGKLISTEKTIKVTIENEDRNIEARYVNFEYKANDDHYGNVTSNYVRYELGREVTLTARAKENYMFVGWYKNDELYSRNKEIIVTVEEKNVYYLAKFIEYPILVNNSIPESGNIISSIDNEDEYLPTYYDDEITYNIDLKPGYTFIGWYLAGELISTDLKVTICLKDYKQTLEAKVERYKFGISSNIEDGIDIIGDVFIPIHYMYGDKEIYTDYVKPNEKLNIYYPDSLDNRTIFAGWYSDKELTNIFNFNDFISKETYIYAKGEDVNSYIEDNNQYVKSINLINIYKYRDGEYYVIGASASGQNEYSSYTVFPILADGRLHIRIFEQNESMNAGIISYETYINGELYENENSNNITIEAKYGDIVVVKHKYYSIGGGSVNYRIVFNIIDSFPASDTPPLESEVKYSSGIVSENTQVELVAKEIDGYYFVGWYEEDTLLTTENTYIIITERKNYNITAKYEKYDI